MFSKIKKFVYDHKIEILIGTAVVGGAVVLYVTRDKSSVITIDVLDSSALKTNVLDPVKDALLTVDNDLYKIKITPEIIDMITNV